MIFYSGRVRRCFHAFALLLVMAIPGSTIGHAASVLDGAREFFVRFVDAQNAHDIGAVRSMIWDSPDFLWISRGVPIRGSTKALDTYSGYFKATWHLTPDLRNFEAAQLPDGSVRIIVPVEFLRAEPGQPAQRSTFLICQLLVRENNGFRISTILPVADTRLK